MKWFTPIDWNYLTETRKNGTVGYLPLTQDETEEKFKSLVTEFGVVNSVERAFELNGLLNEVEFDSVKAKGVYSSKLIDILSKL